VQSQPIASQNLIPSLDSDYWQNLWVAQRTQWDIGYASPAIIDFMAQYPDKHASVLIPGCGNAYEAQALLDMGYTSLTLLDIAPKAIEILQNRFQDQKGIKILCEDYFTHIGKYDVIIEQTFFCAINPDRRNEYVHKASSLLHPEGRIIGVLFDRFFEAPGPPFGGSTASYKKLFEPEFIIHRMDSCYNSIPPRKDTEVFIHLIRKPKETTMLTALHDVHYEKIYH